MPPQGDRHNLRFRIVKIIDDHETKLAQDPGTTQFICSGNHDQYKDIMSYKKASITLKINKMKRLCGY